MLQPSDPIVISIVEEPPNELFGLGEVFIKAVGLTGAIALAALLFGIALAGLFIFATKFKASRMPDSEFEKTQPLGLAGK